MYQTIALGQLKNVVELYGRYNLPALPGVRVDPIIATATLKHALRTTGVRSLEISFEDTELKATGVSPGSRVWCNRLPVRQASRILSLRPQASH